MTEGEKYFKQQHDKYLWLRSQSVWNGEQIKECFTKDEVICHEMLNQELFYLWQERTVKMALIYIREVYPDTKEGDLWRVREEYSDMVSAIYG